MLDQWVAQKIPTENRPPPDIPEKRSPGAAGAATGEKEKGIYSQKNNSPNFPENARERLAERELLEATRAVAIAKFKEYRLQAKRLAELVSRGIVAKDAAIDWLHEIAVAQAFVLNMGEDWVQAILSEAFAATASHPMRTETAA